MFWIWAVINHICSSAMDKNCKAVSVSEKRSLQYCSISSERIFYYQSSFAGPHLEVSGYVHHVLPLECHPQVLDPISIGLVVAAQQVK